MSVSAERSGSSPGTRDWNHEKIYHRPIAARLKTSVVDVGLVVSVSATTTYLPTTTARPPGHSARGGKARHCPQSLLLHPVNRSCFALLLPLAACLLPLLCMAPAWPFRANGHQSTGCMSRQSSFALRPATCIIGTTILYVSSSACSLHHGGSRCFKWLGHIHAGHDHHSPTADLLLSPVLPRHHHQCCGYSKWATMT